MFVLLFPCPVTLSFHRSQAAGLSPSGDYSHMPHQNGQHFWTFWLKSARQKVEKKEAGNGERRTICRQSAGPEAQDPAILANGANVRADCFPTE